MSVTIHCILAGVGLNIKNVEQLAHYVLVKSNHT